MPRLFAKSIIKQEFLAFHASLLSYMTSGPLPCWGFLEENFSPYTVTSDSDVCNRDLAQPPNMVVVEDKMAAVDRVAETVAVVERPGHQQASVYSELVYADNKRHKEQVEFRPVLHPVKYSDTEYLWLNSTRRRFVSRTFYEPRVRPRAYSQTTFVRPKTAEQRFVSCMDIHGDVKRKWFKTAVEIKPRKFMSSKVIRSANNNYIGTDTPVEASTIATTIPNGAEIENNGYFDHDDFSSPSRLPDRLSGGGHNGDALISGYPAFNGSVERVDPGASQVYIPQPLKRPLSEDCLINGDLLIDLPNGNFRNSDHSSSLSQYPDLL
ncbi:family with sequence similarity 101, member a [Plakobranchus ocellatus]|uniref:Family with sequence similarity 101, member a n=1 Tax=Plakobranchus ocellatus TaxID=259542 RepID=A0AAV4DFW1_9GAST|nr:family with sequence similarity 101, member a [Plakobranchus ocellatus]